MQRNSLKHYWHVEVLGGLDKPFSWIRLYRRIRRSRQSHYLFWFRLADHLSRTKNRTLKSLAKGINNNLISQHGTEIMLGADIDEGLMVGHGLGIVISKRVKIGKNFSIRQNTTIGIDHKGDAPITIGDNVDVGANSCIIGTGLNIGDNVTIGAMSFINKDIPADHTYITEKRSRHIKKSMAPASSILDQPDLGKS
ncbi:DapH/DapD/GlmU-related protein [Pseudomonas sp. KFB-139]|uniref:DapH/DapD/GlmU-related protein n=1 Tax=Pseudomonas serbiensis TaxID=3064350 RepID=A0ABT9CQG2_9PSED|nr:DapH/DapD/GlmU-related protein [Pseudomonas sp. KFB-138]MDO7927733.1 DapH/DapD/GlmU-related protein [Pseudomonas sp. KFB-138]